MTKSRRIVNCQHWIMPKFRVHCTHSHVFILSADLVFVVCLFSFCHLHCNRLAILFISLAIAILVNCRIDLTLQYQFRFLLLYYATILVLHCLLLLWFLFFGISFKILVSKKRPNHWLEMFWIDKNLFDKIVNLPCNTQLSSCICTCLGIGEFWFRLGYVFVCRLFIYM